MRESIPVVDSNILAKGNCRLLRLLFEAFKTDRFADSIKWNREKVKQQKQYCNPRNRLILHVGRKQNVHFNLNCFENVHNIVEKKSVGYLK